MSIIFLQLLILHLVHGLYKCVCIYTHERTPAVKCLLSSLAISSESVIAYFQMEEVSLLVDALKQLDELFLSVIVVSDTTSL